MMLPVTYSHQCYRSFLRRRFGSPLGAPLHPSGECFSLVKIRFPSVKKVGLVVALAAALTLGTLAGVAGMAGTAQAASSLPCDIYAAAARPAWPRIAPCAPSTPRTTARSTRSSAPRMRP